MKNARNRQNNLHFNIFFCILEELSHIHPTNKFVGFLLIFVKITKVSHHDRYGSKNKFIIQGFIIKNLRVEKDVIEEAEVVAEV